MIQPLRRLMRRSLLALRTLATQAHDTTRFLRASGVLYASAAEARQARWLMTAHRLEKGMALKSPRPGFGGDAAAQLRQLLDEAADSRQDWAWQSAQRTLERHRLHLAGHPVALPMDQWSREDLRAAAQSGFESLVTSRRSVRQFAGGDLPPGALERAVRLALHSPSVCNRSGARVWATTDPLLRQRMLTHQNGHHGFATDASALLVISVRPAVFNSPEERHQGWIDGGLFSMTLIHALHHQALGTCCLNWCVSPRVDALFKREAGLPQDEMVVMLLAVGNLLPHYTVAHSPRRPLHEALQWLDTPSPHPECRSLSRCAS